MAAFPHIAFAAKSDVGRKRKNNEDSFGVFPSLGVYCVADGMGGGDDGEVASAAAVSEVEKFVKAHPQPKDAAYSSKSVAAGVRAAVNSASKWISERAKARNLSGCGSTFVGVCLDPAKPDEAIALHAGDSRLYRIRGRGMQQITKDHSAAELIGAKNEDELNPMFRGMILRAVGIQPSVEIEETPFQLKEGDFILMCSDGLYRMVPEKKIVSIVRDSASPDAAVEALVAAANEAGGIDNVTVVLVGVGSLPPPIPTVELASDASVDRTAAVDSDRASVLNTCETDGETCLSFDTAGDESSDASTFATATNTTVTIDANAKAELSAMAEAEVAPIRPRAKSIALLVAIPVFAVVVAAVVLFAIFSDSGNDMSPAVAPPAAEESNAEAELDKMRRQLEEMKRKTEEENRKADEARRKAEEEAMLAEETRRKAAAEEEAKRRMEEARKAAEEEARRAEEARRKAAEEETRRMEEARRKAAEEEARRVEEARRKAAEEEARRMEEARRKAAEEAARIRAAEEEAMRRKEEALRKTAEEEARRKEEARKAAILEKVRPMLEDAWYYCENNDILEALKCLNMAKSAGYEMGKKDRDVIWNAYNRKNGELNAYIRNRNSATYGQRKKYEEERDEMNSQWEKLFDNRK